VDVDAVGVAAVVQEGVLDGPDAAVYVENVRLHLVE
jgi:hypothetical protein